MTGKTSTTLSTIANIMTMNSDLGECNKIDHKLIYILA